jgi:hypothetical protein
MAFDEPPQVGGIEPDFPVGKTDARQLAAACQSEDLPGSQVENRRSFSIRE